jgi:hypothetical protein
MQHFLGLCCGLGWIFYRKKNDFKDEGVYSLTSKYLYVGFSYPLICIFATCRSSGVTGTATVCANAREREREGENNSFNYRVVRQFSKLINFT